VYSGHVVLGIRPADESAVMLEYNAARQQQFGDDGSAAFEGQRNGFIKNGEVTTMNEATIKAALDGEFKDILGKLAELNHGAEQSKKIAELAGQLEKCNADIKDLKDQLAAAKAAGDDYKTKYEQSDAAKTKLEGELSDSKKAARGAELSAKLKDFTEEEKKSAKDLMDKFVENPDSVEVNAIVNAIKAYRCDKLEAEKAKQKSHEENSSNRFGYTLDSIYGPIDEPARSSGSEGSIFG
jgi:chromosome segregation ATPase